MTHRPGLLATLLASRRNGGTNSVNRETPRRWSRAAFGLHVLARHARQVGDNGRGEQHSEMPDRPSPTREPSTQLPLPRCELRGVVERVTYQIPETGYIVARVAPKRAEAGSGTREERLLALVVAGLRNAEIAEQLYLTPKTVSHHLSAIYTKLGVETRTEAAHAASQLGIVTS